MKRESSLTIFMAILFIWAGMVLAISFVEAPLKFRAPNITVTLGVGIGRLVFNALNKFEILYSLISCFLIYKIKSIKITIPILVIVAIIIIQTTVLLPVLDERALSLIAGKAVSEKSPHIYYVGLEVIKLILLITTGTITAKELTKK